MSQNKYDSSLALPMCKWLEDNDLGKFKSVFTQQEITLKTLLLLTEDDLIAMGMKLGPRRTFGLARVQNPPITTFPIVNHPISVSDSSGTSAATVAESVGTGGNFVSSANNFMPVRTFMPPSNTCVTPPIATLQRLSSNTSSDGFTAVDSQQEHQQQSMSPQSSQLSPQPSQVKQHQATPQHLKEKSLPAPLVTNITSTTITSPAQSPAQSQMRIVRLQTQSVLDSKVGAPLKTSQTPTQLSSFLGYHPIEMNKPQADTPQIQNVNVKAVEKHKVTVDPQSKSSEKSQSALEKVSPALEKSSVDKSLLVKSPTYAPTHTPTQTQSPTTTTNIVVSVTPKVPLQPATHSIHLFAPVGDISQSTHCYCGELLENGNTDLVCGNECSLKNDVKNGGWHEKFCYNVKCEGSRFCGRAHPSSEINKKFGISVNPNTSTNPRKHSKFACAFCHNTDHVRDFCAFKTVKCLTCNMAGKIEIVE